MYLDCVWLQKALAVKVQWRWLLYLLLLDRACANVFGPWEDPPTNTADTYSPRLRPDFNPSDIPCDLRENHACTRAGKAYPWYGIQNYIVDNRAMIKRLYGAENMRGPASRTQGPIMPRRDGRILQPTNACPSEQSVTTPFWANNSDGVVLALVNFHPFEQAVQQEVCKTGVQGRCRDGCQCEQKYAWYRLLAFDPRNECKGVFMDWFSFPSCCACNCYDASLPDPPSTTTPVSTLTPDPARIEPPDPTPPIVAKFFNVSILSSDQDMTPPSDNVVISWPLSNINATSTVSTVIPTTLIQSTSTPSSKVILTNASQSQSSIITNSSAAIIRSSSPPVSAASLPGTLNKTTTNTTTTTTTGPTTTVKSEAQVSASGRAAFRNDNNINSTTATGLLVLTDDVITPHRNHTYAYTAGAFTRYRYLALSPTKALSTLGSTRTTLVRPSSVVSSRKNIMNETSPVSVLASSTTLPPASPAWFDNVLPTGTIDQDPVDGDVTNIDAAIRRNRIPRI